MRNWKKVTAAVLAGLMVMGMTACGSEGEKESSTQEAQKTESTDTTEAKTTDSSEYKTLRIGCGDALNHNLIDLAGVAQSKGYLEEELNEVGWTCEATGFAGQGPEINAALMSNSLDAATYGDFPTLTGTGSGADFSAVAVLDPSLTYGIFVADDAIQEPKDLEGKKIVVQRGTALYYFWEQFVKGTGIDADSIEVINSNASDAVSLLQTGEADAFVSAGYSLGYYEKQGLGHRLEGYDIQTGSTSTYFVINDSVLKESPEVAVALNKALIRAYNDITADPDSFYELLGERYGAEAVKEAYGFDETLSYLTPEFTDDVKKTLNGLYDWMNKNQLLGSEFDPESVLATEYYDQAVKELEEK